MLYQAEPLPDKGQDNRQRQDGVATSSDHQYSILHVAFLLYLLHQNSTNDARFRMRESARETPADITG